MQRVGRSSGTSLGRRRRVGMTLARLEDEEQMKSELRGWEINDEKMKKDGLDCADTPA